MFGTYRRDGYTLSPSSNTEQYNFYQREGRVNLHEYQSKNLFDQYKIPVPHGRVATSPQEVYDIAKEIGGTVVVKAQVLTGGRGKAGGVKLAKSPDEARDLSEQ